MRRVLPEPDEARTLQAERLADAFVAAAGQLNEARGRGTREGEGGGGE